MARSSFRTGNEVNQALPGREKPPDVVQQALERLSRYAHFRAHTKTISIDYCAGTLVVKGQVPSFYLKQVLQTILRDVPGVVRVDNRVEVPTFRRQHGSHFSSSRNTNNEQYD